LSCEKAPVFSSPGHPEWPSWAHYHNTFLNRLINMHVCKLSRRKPHAEHVCANTSNCVTALRTWDPRSKSFVWQSSAAWQLSQIRREKAPATTDATHNDNNTRHCTRDTIYMDTSFTTSTHLQTHTHTPQPWWQQHRRRGCTTPTRARAGLKWAHIHTHTYTHLSHDDNNTDVVDVGVDRIVAGNCHSNLELARKVSSPIQRLHEKPSVLKGRGGGRGQLATQMLSMCASKQVPQWVGENPRT